MKVILDVNHPGDVHFIKNLYWELIDRNHDVLVVASKKPLTYELLEEYGIPFYKIGSYGRTIYSKAIKLLWLDIKFLILCLRFKPNVMLGTVAFRIAHIGWLLKIRTYCFDDTEHAREQTRLITPFTTFFVTPINYAYDFGRKHIRYNGYHELAYLHPMRYHHSNRYIEMLGLNSGEKYSVIRFVSWNATHDRSNIGLTKENKISAVEKFLKYGRVFITSECPLEAELKDYELDLPVRYIHNIIAGASIVFGESSTMASEAACLGVPAIFVDDYGRCYTDEQEEKYNMVYCFSLNQQEEAIKKAIDILSGSVNPAIFEKGHKKLLNEKMDVTSLQLSLINED